MKRRPLLIVAALAVALAGCAAKAPPQPASSLQLPSGWRAQAAGAEPGSARVEQLWWQSFGDPVLSNLVATALAHNGDLRVALLKRADGPPLKVQQGQTLPNGWRLEQLTPRDARFVLDGRTQTLSLRALRLPPPSTTPPITLPHESTP